MTNDQATALSRDVLRELAPEVDFATADPDAPLAEVFDLDSFGFLTLVELLHERAGVQVPERDYPRLSSLQGLVGYLVSVPG